MNRKAKSMFTWERIASAFAGFGMLFVWVLPAWAQWSGQSGFTMHRGLIAHTIFNPGMTGERDNGEKQAPSSFSYPMGRSVKVYSGGAARGWNLKANSSGEGFWVLSNTGGTAHVSAAGSEVMTPDVSGRTHDPSVWPEAYLGVTEHPEYALAIRDGQGLQSPGTESVNLTSVGTNWWPTIGGIASPKTPINRRPVSIWNFRYGRYNSGETFTERIAGGQFPALQVPFWAEALSEDAFPELVVVSGGESTRTGLQWTRKWYQWGHADYDDFLINETVVENASSGTQEGVYIVLQNRFWSQQAGGWRNDAPWNRPNDWSRDNHARSTMAANYMAGVSQAAFLAGEGKSAGLQIGRDLAESGHAMLYAHDGESLHFTNASPDIGDPYRAEYARTRFLTEQSWINEGFLNHAQYFGVGVIDAFPPFNTYGGADPEVYVAPHDRPATPHDESRIQPASVTIWRYTSRTDFEHPSPLRDSPGFIYDTLTQAGFPDEPEEAYSYSHFVTFGPYTLQPGDKCKVVVAYVGGQGANAPKYSDYKRYPQPFNFGWMNLFGGTGQPDVSFLGRQQEIPLGEEAMFRHFRRAIDVYEWGYDVPNQPPSVKLAYESNLDGQTVLRWSAFGEASPDPDYEGDEALDIRGYRIYRSRVENQGPWEFLAEFTFADARSGRLHTGLSYDPEGVFQTAPGSVARAAIPLRTSPYHSGLDPLAGPEVNGLYQFKDVRSKAGFPNWYSVRMFDSGHGDWKNTDQSVAPLESAPGPSGGAAIGGTIGIVPVVPSSDVFNRFEQQVKVVPNPWKADDDLHTYQRQVNLRFTNLPSRCVIDIYDVTGQHVWSKNYDEPDLGEYTWVSHKTFGGANKMHSGIYFWRVTSYMPESYGKVQQGTFAVIK